MSALFARLIGLFRATPQNSSDESVAHSLLERAEAHTGSDARQLRRAAVAYLSVVR
ncbi:MAG: hypothetical protein H7255_01265 [Ramlibacter sp.]|nr:hypothetical protein [Ramlibacter sp.]